MPRRKPLQAVKPTSSLGTPGQVESNWGILIDNYITKWRAGQGLAVKTRQLDQTQLIRLLKWVVMRDVSHNAFGEDHALQFAADLDTQYEARGVNMTLQACRLFGDYLVHTDVWEANPFRTPGVRNRRETRGKRPQGLTADELAQLLAAPDRRKANGLRDYLVIYIMAFCGLRSGEVCRLKASDLHEDSCRLRVVDRKTSSERWPWLPHRKLKRKRILLEELEQPLRRWLVIRRAMGLGPDDPLFCSVSRHEGHREQGSALTPLQILQAVVRYERKAGIPRRSPHKLRHTAGYLMARGGLTGRKMSVDEIMEQLGHVSVDTCLHYIKGTAEDVGDAYAQADVSSTVRVPTRKRAKVLRPDEIDDTRKVLESLGVGPDALRAILEEYEGE